MSPCTGRVRSQSFRPKCGCEDVNRKSDIYESAEEGERERARASRAREFFCTVFALFLGWPGRRIKNDQFVGSGHLNMNGFVQSVGTRQKQSQQQPTPQYGPPYTSMQQQHLFQQQQHKSRYPPDSRAPTGSSRPTVPLHSFKSTVRTSGVGECIIASPFLSRASTVLLSLFLRVLYVCHCEEDNRHADTLSIPSRV